MGAGTGKLTSELMARGPRVIAVEPVAQMAGALSARLPDLQVLVATAESTGLAQALPAAQSPHWFALGAAVQKIRRLLRPGGWLVLLWNRRDRSHPTWQAVAELVEPLRAEDPTPEGDRWRSAHAVGREFGAVVHRRFAHTVTAICGGLEDSVLSISNVACQPPEVRRRMRTEPDRIWSRRAPLPGGDRLPYPTDAYLGRAGA